MTRKLRVAAVVALGATASVAALTAGSSAASSTAPATVRASAVVHRSVISLASAKKLATAAQADCARRGFAVTVAVVDPDGLDVVVQRADGATGATVDVARGKAHASAGFQSPSGALQQLAKTNPGFTSLPGFVILPGGEPIVAGRTLVGGVGVSGAPSGDIDDACAKVGLKAIS